MRKLIAGIIGAMVIAIAAPGNAQSKLVVVELFTSQGCSSCPPADALLAKLTQRDYVIPLALHVDYWDYIGWKDIFGDKAYTARQKAYASAAGKRTIYTPQMIIGGTDHVAGHKPMDVVDLINAQMGMESPVELHISRNGDKVQIAASVHGNLKQTLIIQLVRYEPMKAVKITRGENAGRTIDYANVVTEWQEIGRWNGSEPLQMDVQAKGAAPIVVLLQEPGPGQILAAARLR